MDFIREVFFFKESDADSAYQSCFKLSALILNLTFKQHSKTTFVLNSVGCEMPASQKNMISSCRNRPSDHQRCQN